jgi:hypothetical protein
VAVRSGDDRPSSLTPAYWLSASRAILTGIYFPPIPWPRHTVGITQKLCRAPTQLPLQKNMTSSQTPTAKRSKPRCPPPTSSPWVMSLQHYPTCQQPSPPAFALGHERTARADASATQPRQPSKASTELHPPTFTLGRERAERAGASAPPTPTFALGRERTEQANASVPPPFAMGCKRPALGREKPHQRHLNNNTPTMPQHSCHRSPTPTTQRHPSSLQATIVPPTP